MVNLITVATNLAFGCWQEHWQRRWYPVAYLEDLDRRRPTTFTASAFLICRGCTSFEIGSRAAPAGHQRRSAA